MKGKVKVSVLIPSYNHAKYISDAINSVINQTYKDIEILIGDDCSTDNSREIINSFKDSRIKKFFYTENCGGSENLNRLIRQSTGKYIAILNSDDYWNLNKIEKQVEFLEENPKYGACFTWVQYINEKGEKTYPEENVFLQENKTQAEWLRYFFENGNCLCHPSILIRKEVYNEIGLYYTSSRQLPDFMQWIKLIKKYPIYIMNEQLVNFRWFNSDKNTSGCSVANTNRTNCDYFRIATELFDDCPKELIIKAFRLNKSKCMKSDILYDFEKNLYLYNNRIIGNSGKLVAYNNIAKLLDVEEYRILIYKEYSFDINSLYNLGAAIKTEPEYVIEYKEKLPDNITYSRGYRMLNKIYSSKIYNIVRKTKKAKN